MAQIAKISVAVESAVHLAIKELLQSIHDKHGIVVERIDVSWVDISVHGCAARHIIDRVSVGSYQEYSDIPHRGNNP